MMKSSSSYAAAAGANINANNDDLARQLAQYSSFIDGTLKPELEVAEQAVATVQAEMSDYEELKSRLEKQLCDKAQQVLPEEDNDSMIDLGYSLIYCRARAKETLGSGKSMVFVDVGLGFHVEMTAREGMEFCKTRIEFLKAHRLDPQQAKVAEIKDHILSATNILMELHREIQNRRGDGD